VTVAARTAKVVIVGGGVAGLALARQLVRRGRDVLVLEAGPRAGGLIHSERIEGWLCEHAANAFLDAEDGAVPLMRELGVDIVEASPAAKKRWVYRGGKLRAVPSSPPGLARTDLLSWRGKLRLFAEPFVPRARRDGASDDETVDAFFRRRLGREAAEALVAPFVLGVWAGESDALSMAAAFPKLAELERAHGSILRGVIAERRKARRDGKAASGRPHLWAPREGAVTLVRALAAELGPRVRTGARVVEIAPGRVRVAPGLGGGEWIEAARLVLAAPAGEAAPLLAPRDPALGALVGGVPSAPVLVAFAGFRAADVPAAVDGFGLLVARGEAPRVLGVVFESVVWPGRAPEGHVLLRLIYGGARDPGAVALGDEAVRGVVAEDLARTLGVRAAPVFLRCARHRGGIPQYAPGHAARVAEMRARAAALGITLFGNAYHGVAVNDQIREAALMAEQLA
jgi:oxygen-dependent protoporphyrinogen oxidase